MDNQTVRQVLQSNKARLFAAYPLSSMALFGSYADGTATENSDVDIMVEFNEPVGFEFIELENLLHKPVDQVTKQAIKPKLMPYISRQLIYV